MSSELTVYIDGASKGNPGPSGIGVVICRGGEPVQNISRYIGHATNNVAEYTALICGLMECRSMKADSVALRTDSQLLARQINGAYKVRHPGILELYMQCRQLIAGFKKFSIQHIPREENLGADKLANEAVKGRDTKG
ncbi:MAG: ribonuclease HI family protein [Candidatus Omnitrophica bacterium]|nr:ribonuclease HI family protein [Candidatus Omnitrophota bacterium]